MQQVAIIGNVAWNNSELRYTSTGKPVMDLSVAVNTYDKQNDEKITTWYKVTLWNDRAVTWDTKLRDRAKTIYASGDVEYQVFKRKNGDPGMTPVIRFANTLEVAAWKSDGEPAAAAPVGSGRNQPQPYIEDEGDMPF